jgi:diguanylate cyclase (GGDEF)-like protein
MPRRILHSVVVGLGSLMLTAIMGLADYYTGPQLSPEIFYLLPVALAAWYGSRTSGIIIALLEAITWSMAEVAFGKEFSSDLVFALNILIRLASFMIVVLLLAHLRENLVRVHTLANSDPLTGILNRRGFYSKVAAEMRRLQRFNHPFSIAYLDIDNFKKVNDTLGHGTGDELLCSVARILESRLRQTDVIGRLGGDEFAIMLVETDAESTIVVLRNIWVELSTRIERVKLPVTFSIGLVTYEAPPESIEQVLGHADSLMYSVKRSGKDGIMSMTWRGKEKGAYQLMV